MSFNVLSNFGKIWLWFLYFIVNGWMFFKFDQFLQCNDLLCDQSWCLGLAVNHRSEEIDSAPSKELLHTTVGRGVDVVRKFY